MSSSSSICGIHEMTAMRYRRTPKPFVLLVLTVLSLAGCAPVVLSHSGISNPVVLGHRLQISDEVNFRVNDPIAEYRVVAERRDTIMLGPTSMSRTNDVLRTAAEQLHRHRRLSVQGVSIDVDLRINPFLIGATGLMSLTASGGVVEVQPSSPFDAAE